MTEEIKVLEITAKELKAMLVSDNPPLVLDVREPCELADGIVPGSVHIPMQTIPTRLDELPRDKIIVAQCAVGQRSYAVAEYLLRNGFKDVRNLSGGIMAWLYFERFGG